MVREGVLAIAMLGAGIVRPVDGATPQGRQRTLAVGIVDSTRVEHWNPIGDWMFTYSVEFRRTALSDTVSGVIPPLGAVTDSTAVGLLLDSAGVDRWMFRYTVRAGLETAPIPKDTWPFFHDIAVSPDGRHVLYLAALPPVDVAPVVVRWPGAPVVWRGAARAACECDVDLHHARWLAADEFEFAVQVGRSAWEVVRANLATGAAGVDTLRREPSWHR